MIGLELVTPDIRLIFAVQSDVFCLNLSELDSQCIIEMNILDGQNEANSWGVGELKGQN